MKLLLVPLPTTLRGIYGTNKDKLGAHQLFAHPDLANAIAKMEGDGVKLIYSDIFRSAQGSLDAKRKKGSIVQPPGYSAHNYGLAVDLDVVAIMKEMRIDKKKLDELLASYGLHCHRLDHALGSESWHYNALGPKPEQWLHPTDKSTAGAVERKILSLYGASFEMTDGEMLAALASLKIYSVESFQRAWDLEPDGVAGPRTKRTLALVSATR